VSCEFEKKKLFSVRLLWRVSLTQHCHSIAFGCAALFFGKMPTEGTEDKSVSLTQWKIYRSSIVLFKDSLKDSRYCSLGFFIGLREEVFGKEFGPWKGDDKVKMGYL
jgi:hypothetical protein